MPAHATGAVEFIALEDIATDDTFRLRPRARSPTLGHEPRPPGPARAGGAAPVAGSGERRTPLAGGGRVPPHGGRPAPRPRARAGAPARGALRRRRLGQSRSRRRSSMSRSGRPTSARCGSRLGASGVAPWAEELVEDALVRAPVSPELRERFIAFLHGRAPTNPTATATATGEHDRGLAPRPRSATPAPSRVPGGHHRGHAGGARRPTSPRVSRRSTRISPSPSKPGRICPRTGVGSSWSRRAMYRPCCPSWRRNERHADRARLLQLLRSSRSSDAR